MSSVLFKSSFGTFFFARLEVNVALKSILSSSGHAEKREKRGGKDQTKLKVPSIVQV